MVNRLRVLASSGTALATPWAEKITGCDPGGASESSLMKTTPLAFSEFDDEFVVHDLVPNIDRRAEELQRAFNGVDRPDDARAEAAGRAKDDTKGGFERSAGHDRRPMEGQGR